MTTWTQQPPPPSGTGVAEYHLNEDGTRMLYEDGTGMLLSSSGLGQWVQQATPVGVWTEEPVSA